MTLSLKRPISYLFSFFLLLGCAKSNSLQPETGSGNPYENVSTYYSTVNKIVIEVLYEPGAEPYTGTTAKGVNYWDLLQDNLQALFSSRPHNVTIEMPKTIEAMKKLSSQNKTVWKIEDLIKVATENRSSGSTQTTAYFTIVFVKGNSADANGNPDPSVIGFNVTGTPFIAIFKDVVTANAKDANSKFMEQSTLIHEMGHALGIVNNGVPMISSHQDTEHGKHCSNPDCVMYWLNEGPSELVKFVSKFLKTGNKVIFGSECLEDTAKYSP